MTLPWSTLDPPLSVGFLTFYVRTCTIHTPPPSLPLNFEFTPSCRFTGSFGGRAPGLLLQLVVEIAGVTCDDDNPNVSEPSSISVAFHVPPYDWTILFFVSYDLFPRTISENCFRELSIHRKQFALHTIDNTSHDAMQYHIM